MGTRSQSRIRRDLNRIVDTVDKHPDIDALQALGEIAKPVALKVNAAAKDLIAARLIQDKEAGERETAVRTVVTWLQTWRPIFLLAAPGALANIGALPPSGSTPDDILSVAGDLKDAIDTTKLASGKPLSFRAAALKAIGNSIATAKKEAVEASTAFTAEEKAGAAFADATIEANPIVVRGSQSIRGIFGRTSNEYRRLIARTTPAEKAENDQLADPPPPV